MCIYKYALVDIFISLYEETQLKILHMKCKNLKFFQAKNSLDIHYYTIT